MHARPHRSPDFFASGESGATDCQTLFQCALSFMVSGWQGGGLGDLLKSPRDDKGYPQRIGDSETYRMLLRSFWELAYFILVPTCLVSTVTGVIVDSFGDSRAKRQERRDALQAKCYVCGIAASDFRGASSFSLVRHCLNTSSNFIQMPAWLQSRSLQTRPPSPSLITCQKSTISNIIFRQAHADTRLRCPLTHAQLLKRIKDCKSPDELSAQEHWLMTRINSLDETLFPIGASLSMNQMLSADSQAAADADKATTSALASVQQMMKSLQNLFLERFSSLERRMDTPVGDGPLRLPLDYQDPDFERDSQHS